MEHLYVNAVKNLQNKDKTKDREKGNRVVEN